jgi:ABC-type glycerol-3-phosphate transport system substrate-binding protein
LRRGAVKESGVPAAIANPVSLLFLSDGAIDAQQELFGRFTQEQPKVRFEFSPNPPGQAARDRVKVMHQAGTPVDLWESARAAFGDLLLIGAIASLSEFIRRDKVPFDKLFVPDHVDHVTVQDKVYGWPASIGADVLAYNKDLFDARGLPVPPTNADDPSWTMEKFLDVAQKLTRGDGQVFGFGGTRSGFPRLADGTNWGQPPWDGKTKVLLDTPLWRQATQFWLDCRYKWHIQPTTAEAAPLKPSSGPFFFNGKTGMDVVFGLPPTGIGFRWGSLRCPAPLRGRTWPAGLASSPSTWAPARTRKQCGRRSSGSARRRTPEASP